MVRDYSRSNGINGGYWRGRPYVDPYRVRQPNGLYLCRECQQPTRTEEEKAKGYVCAACFERRKTKPDIAF